MMDFFLAGSDTTSTSLLWAMLFMIQFPSIQVSTHPHIPLIYKSSRHYACFINLDLKNLLTRTSNKFDLFSFSNGFRMNLTMFLDVEEGQLQMPIKRLCRTPTQSLRNAIGKQVLPTLVCHTKPWLISGLGTKSFLRVPQSCRTSMASIMIQGFGTNLRNSTHKGDTAFYMVKVFSHLYKILICRFLDEDGKFKGRGDNLHPFGIGRRYCLGQSLAEKEFFLFFTGILHQFKLERVEGECLPGKRSTCCNIIEIFEVFGSEEKQMMLLIWFQALTQIPRTPRTSSGPARSSG